LQLAPGVPLSRQSARGNYRLFGQRFVETRTYPSGFLSHTHQLAERIPTSRERIVPIGTLRISAAPVFHAFEADEQDDLSLLFRHLRQSPVKFVQLTRGRRIRCCNQAPG
jgi:hypothetical protein